MNITGKRIKYCRNLKGLTQKDLGRLLGLAISTISGYELGTSEPDNNTIKKMAEIFDCSADFLLGIVDDMQNKLIPKSQLPKELSELVDYIEILKDYDILDISLDEFKYAIEFAKKIKGK